MLLSWYLRRQAGAVAVSQSAQCGISADAMQRRAAQGEWSRLHHGVYLAGGHRLTDEARLWAAALWAGDRATISGAAAAFRHGMRTAAPAEIEVTVPRALHRLPSPGVRIRRRDLTHLDRIGIDGIWVTEKPLAALETALEVADGSVFLDRALQRHVRFAAVHRAYCRHIGTRGWSRAFRLLVAAADRADSAAERLLVRLLRVAGIEGWVLGHRAQGHRIDLAFPGARLAVEVDGWAWHVDAERFRTDRRRQNALVGAGWVVLRFTWHDLAGRADAVVASIRSALAAAA